MERKFEAALGFCDTMGTLLARTIFAALNGVVRRPGALSISTTKRRRSSHHDVQSDTFRRLGEIRHT
jgi:hypothetical protein